MSKETRKIIPWAVTFVILLVIAGALLYGLIGFHIVDFRFYPKDATVLDLRGQEISPSHFYRLSNRMPGCKIYWDVPFQGKLYSSDSQELIVTSLTEEDVEALWDFTDLKVLHAQACQDYPQLLAAARMYPKLKLDYQIPLGDTEYASDSRKITLSGLNSDELPLLDNLTRLEAVTVTSAPDRDAVAQLQKYCKAHEISFSLKIGDKTCGEETEELRLREATSEDLALLACLPNLKKVSLRNPAASPEDLLALKEACPNAEVTWEYVLGGVLITTEDTEVDLSEVEITGIEQVEKALSYFPNVEQVFLGDCGIDNDELAAYRERVRSDYKVVWIIHLGNSTKDIRTDITYFFPGRDGPVFNDKTSYNIRYCEDLICVDVGHLGVHEISWVETLTNLEYLILAHTGVISLEGIENCKKLKFLEIHWTGVRDLTPLKGLTALEDLNFGKTWPDVSALMEMPWLKNVYMILGSGKDAAKLTEALPNTRVVASGTHTVAGGWRRLPNYYAMRDALNAPYMN